jgi:signal transduction histidine kinase
VAVSLVLSGTLTWALVSRLTVTDANDQLVPYVQILRPQVNQLGCALRNAARRCLQRTQDEGEFLAQVDAQVKALNLGDARVLLLGTGPPPLVVYDSASSLLPGTPIAFDRLRRVRGTTGATLVVEGQIDLGGSPYIAAATPVSTPFARWLVLARPESDVARQATGQLLRPILLAGLAALLVAIVAGLAVSRAFGRPLQELRKAAEDIAAGNYGRRVASTGNDEVGVVAQAFNRMAEAVERARTQQQAFLANVSHELKTPLTSLIGFSQALMDGSLRTEEERSRAVAILHEEARRVLRMAQELLDLARMEAGQLTFDLQPVDLRALLDQELELIRPRALRRGLSLQLRLPTALPPVRADPDRLHQILENLLDNAVKYAPAGSEVEIVVTLEGGRVVTTVTNPVGAPAPDPARIFDRFYRAAPGRSASSGAGLGLAICKELATAQEGSLSAELVPPGSLALRLELPAATRGPDEAARPTSQPQSRPRLPAWTGPVPGQEGWRETPRP